MSRDTVITDPKSIIPDEEYRKGIELLKTQFPAFQRYQEELAQFIVDSLSGVNCMIEANIEGPYFAQRVTTKTLREIQRINQEVMKKVRE